MVPDSLAEHKQRKAPGESGGTRPGRSAQPPGILTPAPAPSRRRPRAPRAPDPLPWRPRPPEASRPHQADGYLELLVLALIQQLFETKRTFRHHRHWHFPSRSPAAPPQQNQAPLCPSGRRARDDVKAEGAAERPCASASLVPLRHQTSLRRGRGRRRSDPPSRCPGGLTRLLGAAVPARSKGWAAGVLCIVEVFPVVVYGCESWTVKKAERRRIDAFELWCWRRLLRVPRRSALGFLWRE